MQLSIEPAGASLDGIGLSTPPARNNAQCRDILVRRRPYHAARIARNWKLPGKRDERGPERVGTRDKDFIRLDPDAPLCVFVCLPPSPASVRHRRNALPLRPGTSNPIPDRPHDKTSRNRAPGSQTKSPRLWTSSGVTSGAITEKRPANYSRS